MVQFKHFGPINSPSTVWGTALEQFSKTYSKVVT